MDILDFFWTFYLNHLSPLWGYFSDLGQKVVASLNSLIDWRKAQGF